MRAMLRRLWNEDEAVVISAEIMLVASILVIGLIVGLKSVRDAVVTELDDVATAFSGIDNGYYFGSGREHGNRHRGGDRGRGQADRCINVAAWDGGER